MKQLHISRKKIRKNNCCRHVIDKIEASYTASTATTHHNIDYSQFVIELDSDDESSDDEKC